MTRILRSFLPRSSVRDDEIVCLGEDESRHLSKVLRIRKGAKIEVFDGEGTIFQTKCIEITKDKVQVEILNQINADPVKPQIHLGVSIIRGKRWEQMIKPLTELGVSRITPLVSEHTDGLLSLEKWESKNKKWNKLAVEACKQSGNPWLPEISVPQGFEEYLLSSGKNTWIGSTSTSSVLHPKYPNDSKMSLLIGPEGGWSNKEEELALEHGARAFSLGPFALRVEHAAVSALAVARSLFLG